jgi:hypothetical protein
VLDTTFSNLRVVSDGVTATFAPSAFKKNTTAEFKAKSP